MEEQDSAHVLRRNGRLQRRLGLWELVMQQAFVGDETSLNVLWLCRPRIRPRVTNAFARLGRAVWQSEK
jgi:hypothetical protein